MAVRLPGVSRFTSTRVETIFFTPGFSLAHSVHLHARGDNFNFPMTA